MFESIRKVVPVPAIPLEGSVALGTGAAFVWLLVKGYIQPLAIYFLELYLSF